MTIAMTRCLRLLSPDGGAAWAPLVGLLAMGRVPSAGERPAAAVRARPAVRGDGVVMVLAENNIYLLSRFARTNLNMESRSDDNRASAKSAMRFLAVNGQNRGDFSGQASNPLKNRALALSAPAGLGGRWHPVPD